MIENSLIVVLVVLSWYGCYQRGRNREAIRIIEALTSSTMRLSEKIRDSEEPSAIKKR